MIYKNAGEVLEDLYGYIMHFGHDNGSTKAIYNVKFEIENPNETIITTPWRKFKKEYADFEVDWYMTQDTSTNIIGEAAKIWKSMGVHLNSNYGYQVQREGQLAKVINLLAEHKETRRAVVSIYDGKEIDIYAEDTPCCLGFAFRITDDKLYMTINFRSQDLIFGFCNDQYTLYEYHALVLRMLKYKRYPDLTLGSTTWFVNDLHIYERHQGKREKFYEKN